MLIGLDGSTERMDYHASIDVPTSATFKKEVGYTIFICTTEKVRESSI